MKKLLLVGGMFVLLSGLCGCGGKDTHESLTKEGIDLMGEYIDTLDKINDEESAKAAKPKLEALAKKGQDLKKRMEAIGKPSKEEEERLQKKFSGDIAKLAPKMFGAMAKLQKYPELKDIKMEMGK
jgi:hypothetical protein